MAIFFLVTARKLLPSCSLKNFVSIPHGLHSLLEFVVKHSYIYMAGFGMSMFCPVR